MLSGLVSKTSGFIGERESSNQRSEGPTPHTDKHYNSLDDITETVENEHSWGIEFPEKDKEKVIVDTFLSSQKTAPEPIQFQADTVIL